MAHDAKPSAAAHTGRVLRWVGAGIGLVGAVDLIWTLVRERQLAHSWEDPALIGIGVTALVAGLVVYVAGAWLSLRAAVTSRGTTAGFLTPDEEERVLAAIRAFEDKTSGEIRVHLAGNAPGGALAAAQQAFLRIGMAKTRDRNGVMFFVAVAERAFAVVGDTGIDAAVPPGFWDGVVARVKQRFTEKKFADGLCEGIAMAGEALCRYFPHRDDDVNELPDTISRD